jgi:ribosomal protein S12 methylthiotransferase accessory factor YcaO
MRGRQLAARQAQWARFRAWEDSQSRGTASISGEAAIRAVGEVIEFYLEVTGGLLPAGRSVGATVEAVRRLRDALRFAVPAR